MKSSMVTRRAASDVAGSAMLVATTATSDIALSVPGTDVVRTRVLPMTAARGHGCHHSCFRFGTAPSRQPVVDQFPGHRGVDQDSPPDQVEFPDRNGPSAHLPEFPRVAHCRYYGELHGGDARRRVCARASHYVQDRAAGGSR